MLKPAIPYDYDQLPPDLDSLPCASMRPVSGTGFFADSDKIRLPNALAHAVIRLSLVDEKLDACRWTSLDDQQALVIRDIEVSTQRLLLCVPTWADLCADERSASDRSIYECCRLTAILYSTAVIYPVPPDHGWYDISK
jgi:hypothetical protein